MEEENKNESINNPEQNAVGDKLKSFETQIANQVNKILNEFDVLSSEKNKINASEKQAESILLNLKEIVDFSKSKFDFNLKNKITKDFGVKSGNLLKLQKELKLLGDLSEKHNGVYHSRHVESVFNVIKKKINELKKDLNKVEDKKDKFSFQ